jgi:ADP-ribosyl-[dinitrogen reductase] hydrolase
MLASALEGDLKASNSKASVLSAARPASASGRLNAIAVGAYRGLAMDQIFGTGTVVDCLEAALWCFDHTTSFRDAVLAAANLGDDADTTAAVCGQIAGAH